MSWNPIAGQEGNRGQIIITLAADPDHTHDLQRLYIDILFATPIHDFKRSRRAAARTRARTARAQARAHVRARTDPRQFVLYKRRSAGSVRTYVRLLSAFNSFLCG